MLSLVAADGFRGGDCGGSERVAGRRKGELRDCGRSHGGSGSQRGPAGFAIKSRGLVEDFMDFMGFMDFMNVMDFVV